MNMAEIITVLSGKGGVGKTTLTAYSGQLLAQKGYRVLIVDGDMGLSNIDIYFQMEECIELTIGDVLRKEASLQGAMYEVEDRLWLLPATSWERWEELDKRAFYDVIEECKGQFDYIIIDAPAGIGLGPEIVVPIADRWLIVTESYGAAIGDTKKVVEIFEEARKDHFGIIVNKVQFDELDLYDWTKEQLNESVLGPFPWEEDLCTYDKFAVHKIESKYDIAHLTKFLETGEVAPFEGSWADVVHDDAESTHTFFDGKGSFDFMKALMELEKSEQSYSIKEEDLFSSALEEAPHSTRAEGAKYRPVQNLLRLQRSSRWRRR